MRRSGPRQEPPIKRPPRPGGRAPLRAEPRPARAPRHVRKRRWLARLVRLSPLLASLFVTLWVLGSNPFAAPLREATTVETARVIDRAVAARLSPERLETEIATALEAEDLDRIETLLPVAERVGLIPSEAQSDQVAALRARETGWWATTRQCTTCIADVADCPSLRLLALCGIPVELTPIGDLNALRRAGVDWWNEDEVDTFDVTLATVGLGATGALLVSGGTSAGVKAGASALRMARRLRTLTPGLTDEIARLADPALVRRVIAGTGDGADAARLARAQGLAADIGRIAGNTSTADTIVLLRHVDGADDAARLARLSDAAGPQTRGVLELLGKSRAFRALVRLTDTAIAAGLLVWLTATQALMAIAGWIGGRLARPLARGAAGAISA